LANYPIQSVCAGDHIFQFLQEISKVIDFSFLCFKMLADFGFVRGLSKLEPITAAFGSGHLISQYPTANSYFRDDPPVHLAPHSDSPHQVNGVSERQPG
jgi:hypothetical protein